MIRINPSHLCLSNRKSKKEFILQAYATWKYLFCLLREIYDVQISIMNTLK
jgi:hypothetical protein